MDGPAPSPNAGLSTTGLLAHRRRAAGAASALSFDRQLMANVPRALGQQPGQ